MFQVLVQRPRSSVIFRRHNLASASAGDMRKEHFGYAKSGEMEMSDASHPIEVGDNRNHLTSEESVDATVDDRELR
jgi:hypothetical protein